VYVRPRLHDVAFAASGLADRVPLLRWPLGRRSPGAGAVLATRASPLRHLSARHPMPVIAASFSLDSAYTPPPSTGDPDLARDPIDHPPAVAIRLIYVVRATWPVGCACLRRSREDRPESSAPLQRSSIGLPLRRPVGP
jgi:hypothetical protein